VSTIVITVVPTELDWLFAGTLQTMRQSMGGSDRSGLVWAWGAGTGRRPHARRRGACEEPGAARRS
jgi:hypothetical protein